MEVIGGTSDMNMTTANDAGTGQRAGVDGLSRGLFSRINVGYSNTLENGLEITGTISYQLNQRGTGSTVTPASLGLEADSNSMVMVMEGNNMTMPNDMNMMTIDTSAGVDASTNYAPDVLSISVGGGFGTVSVGAHAPASCALLPRPIAFAPGGVNATWYTLFSGVASMNGTFSETNYCGTSESVSYQTPSMVGMTAMVTYAPNMGANQGVTLRNAVDSGGNEDYVSAAAAFSSDMGGMSLNIGGAFQTAANDTVDSQSVAATVSVGGATVGAAWFDNGAIDGYTIGAKYALGNLTPAITYSSQEREASAGKAATATAAATAATPAREETALVIGASYAVGGGLSVFAEYLGIEAEMSGMSDDETLLMSGVIVSF